MDLRVNSQNIQKQPDCLPVLFMTELWERFGFYIVQVLLIFYLINVYHYSDKLSASILGAFTAISYIVPVAGGIVADRYMGYRRAVIFGGSLLSFGYALLAIENDRLFYIALATVAVGTGFLKPNISSFLGLFYEKKDERCEKGYTYFYIGINTGIMLSTLLSGYILEYFGFRGNFLIASLGLIMANGTFILGLNYLQKRGRLDMIRNPEPSAWSWMKSIWVGLGTFVMILFFSQVIEHVMLANMVFVAGLILTIAILSYTAYQSKAHRGSMFACLALMLLSVLFWALYYQLFFAVNLFIDRVVDRHFLGFELPTPIFISSMSIYMILFGPILGALWQRLEKNKMNPPVSKKFALSLFCMALGLISLILGIIYPNAQGLTNKFWIFTAFFMVTLGELLISPITIAMVINMVPPHYVGMMMGAYLACIGFGAKLAGLMAGMAAIPKNISSVAMMMPIYKEAFIFYAKIGIGAGFLILILSPLIDRLSKKKITASPLDSAQSLELSL